MWGARLPVWDSQFTSSELLKQPSMSRAAAVACDQVQSRVARNVCLTHRCIMSFQLVFHTQCPGLWRTLELPLNKKYRQTQPKVLAFSFKGPAPHNPKEAEPLLNKGRAGPGNKLARGLWLILGAQANGTRCGRT